MYFNVQTCSFKISTYVSSDLGVGSAMTHICDLPYLRVFLV